MTPKQQDAWFYEGRLTMLRHSLTYLKQLRAEANHNGLDPRKLDNEIASLQQKIGLAEQELAK